MWTSRDLPVFGQPRGDNVLDGGAAFYDVYETQDGKFVSVGAIEPQFYHALLQGEPCLLVCVCVCMSFCLYASVMSVCLVYLFTYLWGQLRHSSIMPCLKVSHACLSLSVCMHVCLSCVCVYLCVLAVELLIPCNCCKMFMLVFKYASYVKLCIVKQ